MADKLKLCRCKQRRIPDDWPECGVCHDWRSEDLDAGVAIRGERAQLVRVRKGMDFEVTEALDAETKEALIKGIIQRSRERYSLQMRREIRLADELRQRELNLIEMYSD